MFNHIRDRLAPLPRPSPIFSNPSGHYIGLEAIERQGRNNGDPAFRLGRARCMAIRQQDQLHSDRSRLLEEQKEDSLALEAEFDGLVQESLGEYQSNVQSLGGDPRSDGDFLKARKFAKKLQRRIKNIQDQRSDCRTWLNLWFDQMANQCLDSLRREWVACDYCCDYPFWGDEMAPNAEPRHRAGTEIREEEATGNCVFYAEDSGVTSAGC
ncbi:hypothetical protein LX32DRAFT_69576 [Colletotrichum zoysiae]|uniref:Uncharacterized protein n=1 Tax=Colletotrichum zoysiae TaxID=1216348 RepID=A0AAD9HB48_9PEZI|nr:hypothetical protein LX32DRAFT_69576 [Colletotrichum zoysiae]